MHQRTDWHDLPESLREAIAARTGTVLGARSVSEGMNSALAAILDTTNGTVFVKGIRTGHPGIVTQAREAMINPHVQPVAPALLWHIVDNTGWDVLGFEHVEGHHPDYAPGSPDLPAVLAAIDALGDLPCPDLPIKDANRWRSYLDGADPEQLTGETLLHTDYNPSNLLIGDDRTARIVDWAWPTRGAAWIDPCCLLVWLIASGHTPEQAEAHVSQTRAWATAPPAGLDLFARANVRLWDEIAGNNPQDWTQRMATAARTWADARLVPLSR